MKVQENGVATRTDAGNIVTGRIRIGERGGLVRKFLIGIALLSCVFSTSAQAATTLEILPTHRQDRFTWHKAELGGVPNILSELKWENLRIYAIKGVLRHDTGRRTFLEATGSFGWIYSGTNQDSDYDENDRQGEFSRTYANAGDGRVLDGSLAFGWKLQEKAKQQTTLLGGYAINTQSLTMRDLFVVISDTAPLGPYPGLNTHYKAMWSGPWLGLEHSQELDRRTKLKLRLEYHLPHYRGECHWNLRTEGISALEQPVTNNHWADGRGTVVSLGLDHSLGKNWSVGAAIDYTSYTANKGTDQVNFAKLPKAQVPLNLVTWDSWAYRLTATYRF